MPYYSELGLTSTPSSSAYSSLLLSGPYSNHSSIIASNFSSPKPLSRHYRGGYKPHLSTITELNSPRRINPSKLLYHSSPKVTVRPIKKINTADIDVSVNKYRKYDKYERPKTEIVEKKAPDKAASPKRSPRASVEEKDQKEAKPNTNIRRDRTTIRLHTVHKDTLEEEIGAIRSWRDNFKPEELGTEAKRRKKTPGEILKEKFLIRSRSKENILKAEAKKLSRKNFIKKSPSFQEICEAITCDNIDVELNPGQPEEVQRRQSRQISGEKILKEIRRNSTDLSEDDLKILDAILLEQNNLSGIPEVDKMDSHKFESRGSVRKKKVRKYGEDEGKRESRITKSSSKEKICDNEPKSPLQRRSVQKRLHRPDVEENTSGEETKADKLTEKIYENVIRDISQVEIEQTAFKPKPVITGSGDIEETKPSLIAVINEVEVQEAPKPKKEKKFRFNVIVEVEEEETESSRSATPDELKPKRKLSFKTPKISAKKMTITNDQNRTVQIPEAAKPVISSILKKRPSVHFGKVITEKEKIVKNDQSLQKDESDKAGSLEPCQGVKLPENKSVVESKLVENDKNTAWSERNLPAKLQKSSSSTSSGENSPVPSSPIIKEKNFFNRMTPKNENASAPNLFETKPVQKQNTSLPGTPIPKVKNLLDKEYISAPSSPIAKKKFPFISRDVDSTEKTPHSSPLFQKEHANNEIFETPPSSPLLKKEEIFNKEILKKTDAPPTSTSVKKENALNKEISKKVDTPPASPITKKDDLFRKVLTKKEDTPPTSPTVSTKNLANKKILEDVKDKIPSQKLTQKDENDNTINVYDSKEVKPGTEVTADSPMPSKKIVSKRSLVQKANKDDPDLMVFVVPDPEPEPEPQPEEVKKDVFVPLQSNRLSQWMHPWKKPEQLEVCPVEIFARPKVIRGRHYPRPRGQPVPKPEESDSSSEESDEEDESEDETTSSEEESSEEESDGNMVNNKIGASTSSNDSGFGSGAPGRNKDCDVNIHKKCEKLTANLCGVNQKLVVEAIESVRKGSLESRDSPTSNHANNPAFALDSGDIPEEYSQSSTFTGFQKSGRITPPATTIPRFRKYCVDDFNFLKVLGKGSFGKVLLAELKGTEYYYAIKCLKKDVVLEDDDVECTLIERKVLALGTKHPYLCHLLCTFQTESHLFFVMEYLNGGDLMFHIQASGRFPEHQARFYGAEIVSGLKFLHNKGIVYRDLKLDNILLDFDGHVRIADFGMCKLQIFLDRMAETFCGTPDYMAPEIIKGQHYNQCVDWWSFGVLLYEMLLGQSPFSGCDEDELFWSICNEKPVLPRYLSSEATNILTIFLEKDASKRLGNRFSPHGDIQDQPFFRPIDWHALEARQLEPPFKPNLQHPLDTQYFDKHFTVEKAKLTPIESTILQSMDQTQFQGFSYTNPNATDK